MRVFQAFLALTALRTITGHSVFTTLFINDINQGDGTCVRMPMNPGTSISPIIDLSSNDMACGFNGESGVARVCPAIRGAKLTFLWREWADGSQPGSIDVSHKGPCSVYMKAVTSAVTDVASGEGWFKIWDEGYDFGTSQWCTERLIANNGLFSVNVPADISGGYYLVRPELLSLQEADKSSPQPQFYIGCAQVFIQTSGATVFASTVSIPGYLTAGDPSVTFNIYTPKFPYPLPGPAAYRSTGGINAETVSEERIQTEGLKPVGCVLVNAYWCGIELNSYDDEAGCWNASKACWDQASTCYSSAPPTGSKNCHISEAKCSGIQSTCVSGTFNGPPNIGKDLNPPDTISYDIPAVRYSIPSSSATSVSVNMIPIPGLMSATGPVSLVTNTFKPSSSTNTLKTPVLSVGPSISSTGDTIDIPANAMTLSPVRMESSSTPTVPLHSTTTKYSYQFTAIPTGNFEVSSDATCGKEASLTCLGSAFGGCCSQWGWCGTSDDYCGEGCQGNFGICGNVVERKESAFR